MKKPLLFTSVSFVLLPIIHSCCLAQSLSVGTNSLGIVFDDAGLAHDQRTLVSTDIQRCLAVWGATAEIRWGPNNQDRYLYIPDESPYFPEGVTFPDRLVLNDAGGISLFVSKSVSDAYVSAFSFTQICSTQVQAIFGFVDFVNSTNFFSSATNNLQSYFIHPGFTSQKYAEAAVDLARGFKQTHYHPPSILGFYHSTRGPDETNLWVNLPESSTAYGIVHWGVQPAVWHDGRWKFSFWIYEDE